MKITAESIITKLTVLKNVCISKARRFCDHEAYCMYAE